MWVNRKKKRKERKGKNNLIIKKNCEEKYKQKFYENKM